MNKEEQTKFFRKEIKPYVDLKIKEVFNDIEESFDGILCGCEKRCNCWREFKEKHLNTGNNEKKNE